MDWHISDHITLIVNNAVQIIFILDCLSSLPVASKQENGMATQHHKQHHNHDNSNGQRTDTSALRTGLIHHTRKSSTLLELSSQWSPCGHHRGLFGRHTRWNIRGNERRRGRSGCSCLVFRGNDDIGKGTVSNVILLGAKLIGHKPNWYFFTHIVSVRSIACPV